MKCHFQHSGNYSLCMAIRCEVKLKKNIPASIAILGIGQTTLLTKRDGCVCTRKRPVAFLIFHPFVSFLFLRTHSSREKNTRIVCQPARQAAETIIRSISCSLQLRLKSNERKKFGDKMLKWTFRYYNCFLKWAWFSFKKMQLLTKFWLIRTGTINSSTRWTLFYHLISKNLS